ncbi:hypothetical protein HDV01_001392 [Terramyces sp. JEL0728]|nr:hypothetical protein HDV01_001392 [Terramyces sp. JEL0728]
MNELLDDEERFLPHIKKALVEIFLKYDADKDGVLNPQELDAFVMETSGHTFSETERQELLYFDNKDGQLTLKGFLEMYQLQSLSDPEETTKDLKVHQKI